MVDPHPIPQEVYERAAGDLLGRLSVTMDVDAFHMVWLLHQAADSAREHQSREALDPFGLTWTQFEVLWNIWIFGERDAGWVARAAMISKSGLTSVLTQFERRGLINRRPDVADARRSLISLSEEGRALMVEVIGSVNRADRVFTEPLTSPQKQQLIGLLNKLMAQQPDDSS